MGNDIILKATNISKQYRLGLVGRGTISHDLNRWWSKIRGKEDPYLKVGDINDRATKSGSDYVWALRDINFEIKRGEVIGIIGKNGAGKSTLLKILSKVTGPTTGEIKTKGRIASLLEVGTGFHPEMTGRENIYLNGAILGMTKVEITSKIDDIIDFSGCQRYIDTPVKRYSSGMTVRLAFAVAAFLEPEILVVDEVLAVGDAEFQKKAIGKMQDISKGEGRTVLFVSHNMASIRELCPKTIFMENGSIHTIDKTDIVIKKYLNQNIDNGETTINYSFDKKREGFKRVELVNKTSSYDFKESIKLKLELKFLRPNNHIVSIYFRNNLGQVVFFSESSDKNVFLNQKKTQIEITIPSGILLSDNYYISIGCKTFEGQIIEIIKDVLKITIEDTFNKRKNRPGNIMLDTKWD